jgi:transposase InsO family protein
VRNGWRQLRREGIAVARCTVGRPMRAMGLRGIVRGKTIRTTVSDKAVPCPLDRVNRDFEAPRPNVLWVADGHAKLEALRCLKRYIAREVFALLRKRQRELDQTQFAA